MVEVGGLLVTDVSNAAFTFWPPIVASTGGAGKPAAGTYTPPVEVGGLRGIAVNCTLAGNLTLIDASGNALTVPVAVGMTVLPFVPASFTSSASATFWGVM